MAERIKGDSVENEFKTLLKGKWEYNIKENRLICKNRTGLTYIFENKDDLFFQELLVSLKNARANIDLNVEITTPLETIPLELFHRILRSNEVIFEQVVGIRQAKDGLYCFSDYTKDFRINHHKYDSEKTVYIDPQRMCKITRRLRNRERVYARLGIEDDRIILECEFPWTVLTIILPTVKKVVL